MEELGIECRVGHPAEIRAAEPRKQKHDRRDADLLLTLLTEDRFPAIWLPRKELLVNLQRKIERVMPLHQSVAFAVRKRGPSCDVERR